jgi:hypothetical protein
VACAYAKYHTTSSVPSHDVAQDCLLAQQCCGGGTMSLRQLAGQCLHVVLSVSLPLSLVDPSPKSTQTQNFRLSLAALCLDWL